LAKTTVTTALALYLKWARQHPNKTEHEARAQYDVTSSILGKAPPAMSLPSPCFG